MKRKKIKFLGKIVIDNPGCIKKIETQSEKDVRGNSQAKINENEKANK